MVVFIFVREYTFEPRLSTIRVLTPQRLSQLASISPAGPAPTMRTSTWSSLAGGIWVMMSFEIQIRYASLMTFIPHHEPQPLSTKKVGECGGSARAMYSRLPHNQQGICGDTSLDRSDFISERPSSSDNFGCCDGDIENEQLAVLGANPRPPRKNIFSCRQSYRKEERSN